MADPDLTHIPGDSGLPLLGHTLDIVRRAWVFDARQAARYGSVYRSVFLGRTSVSMTSPEDVGAALVDKERNLSSERGWTHTIGELFQNGLMLRDFEDHRRHRKLMQFAFRTDARRGYHTELERQACAQLDEWPIGEGFAFYPRLKRVLLEQAGRVFLGIEDRQIIADLLDNFVAMMGASLAIIRKPLPGTAWRRGQQGRRRLEQFFAAEIPKRRAGGCADLFSVLCEAEDEDEGKLSNEDIIDHMIFLLFASHDTTATTITTLIDALTLEPELQERAAAECVEFAERTGEVLDFDALDELSYVECCTREALRINPAVPYVPRQVVSACPMAGHELPANTPLVLHIKGVHHDRARWPEPLRFDPERFADPSAMREGPSHAWIPFGAGAHRCIGAELARQQIKVFIFHLLRRYRIERSVDGPTPWRRLPLPFPTDGLPVRLVAR